MAKVLKVTLGLLAVAIAAVLALVPYAALTFIDERVDGGTAYGFTIGDTHAEVYRSAVSMRERGDIAEIKRGQGSAAITLREVSLGAAMSDPSWTIVYDPDWWNDTAILYFEDGTLREIHRFRVCCELP